MGIGRRIKEAREQLRLTQAELAKLVGVTSSAITNYENETSHPKEAVLYKLLDVLQVDANFLFQDCFPIERQTSNFRETNLLMRYRQLNQLGKSKVDEQLEDMISMEKYTCKDSDEKIRKREEQAG